MPRASVRIRSTSMEARMAALEALGSKNQLLLESNQLLLESMQRLLEEKFASIDKRFESIEARFEGSNEIEVENSRRRGGLDHRERERVSPPENRMPFIKMDFPRFNDGDIPAATVEDVEIAVEAAKKAFSRNKGKDWSSVSGAYSARYLRASAAKITERKSELGKLEAIDSGKLCEEGCRLGPVVSEIDSGKLCEEGCRFGPVVSGGHYEKIKMVSFHLDREALQWFQWEECVSSYSKWEDFVKTFCRDFGSHGFEDYYERYLRLDSLTSLLRWKLILILDLTPDESSRVLLWL